MKTPLNRAEETISIRPYIRTGSDGDRLAARAKINLVQHEIAKIREALEKNPLVKRQAG